MLSGFEPYRRWVPLIIPLEATHKHFPLRGSQCLELLKVIVL